MHKICNTRSFLHTEVGKLMMNNQPSNVVRHFKVAFEDIPTFFKILNVENIRDDLIFY